MKTIRLTQAEYDRLNGFKGWLVPIVVLTVGGLVYSAANFLLSGFIYDNWLYSQLISIAVFSVLTVFLFRRNKFFPLLLTIYLVFSFVLYLIFLTQSKGSINAIILTGAIVLIIFSSIILYLFFSRRVAVTFKTRMVEIIPEPDWDDVPALTLVTKDILQSSVVQSLPENPDIPKDASLEEVYGKEYWLAVPQEELQKEEEDSEDTAQKNDPEYKYKRARILAIVFTCVAAFTLIVIIVNFFPPQ